MTAEYHRQKQRRHWTPERRAADRRRRAKQREQFYRYVPCPLKPIDTIRFVHEEHSIIVYLNSAPTTWTKVWTTINDLVGKGTVRETRHRRQLYLALITRMLREKKLIRHRASNTLALPHWLDRRFVPGSNQPHVPDDNSGQSKSRPDGFVVL